MRRHWLLLLIPVLLSGVGWLVAGRWRGPVPDRPQATPPDRPNVVLISLDTLRPDHLSCYGYPRPTSPGLDRFAERAVRFTNCRAQAPWTLPSHMSLFTSLLPSTNGVDGLNKVLPDEVPTLPRLLRAEGYHTAALVNNGQMRAHWGFSRGFDSWREFEVDTSAGACPNLTAEARAWLKARPAGPFFLFLHYYDPHDPYAAPEPYRGRLGTTLAGAEARQLCVAHRFPARPFDDPKLLTDLVAAYDAEIAWLDAELGRLLEVLPENTLVVLFSDHGEAFKEHGWMLHGATLFEEEVRVPLLIRPPAALSDPMVVNDSVMLMDVAPTILAACGVRPPVHFQGRDLGPLWTGGTFGPRLIPAEAKAVLEGRYLLTVVAYPLKGVYSLFDGRFELYRLPDETRPLGRADRVAAEALLKPLRDWVEGEDYWLIHAVGEGDFEATIEPVAGQVGLFIPVGLDPMRDGFDVLDEGRTLRWHVYPGGARPKSLFVQPALPDSALRVDCKANGRAAPELVFVGRDRQHPKALPAVVPADVAPVGPFIEAPFTADRPGFYVFRHSSGGGRPRPARVEPLDEQTIRHLRSLGYLQ